jgi:two-component system NarL family sensor kinase
MNDKYIIPLFLAGSLLLTLFAFFLIVYLVVQKNRQRAFILEKQQMVFEHERSILRTKIEEQEQTMDQISKELHDNIKSVLGFSQMWIHSIADLATNKEQILLIEKTNSTIGQIIDELGNISHSLSGNFVKHIGLVETITKELEGIRLSKNITYNIDVAGNPVPLPGETELQVFRIVQEAAQNCMKHAKATKVDVVLSYSSDIFTLLFSDNGAGFDNSKEHAMKGLGFVNMFQRAKHAHGVLEVDSTPGKGTSVLFTLNLNRNGSNN